MVFTGQKIGFALLPQKATMEQTQVFLQELKEHFPNAATLVSTLQISDGYSDPQVKNNPYVTFATSCNVRQDLVARAFILLAVARTMELDYLVFNTDILRYDLEATRQFVDQAGNMLPHLDIVFGEPPIFNPYSREFRPEDITALEISKVRYRLLVDTLINSILSRNGYSNINAGIFCLKTSRSVLRTLSAVQHYEDSSLVCSQMAWHLRLNNFRIGSVPVQDIKLGTLGFNLDKAVAEINFVMNMVGNSLGGKSIVLADKVSDLFHKQTHFNRWVSRADEEWFYEVVVPSLRKLGCVI